MRNLRAKPNKRAYQIGSAAQNVSRKQVAHANTAYRIAIQDQIDRLLRLIMQRSEGELTLPYCHFGAEYLVPNPFESGVTSQFVHVRVYIHHK